MTRMREPPSVSDTTRQHRPTLVGLSRIANSRKSFALLVLGFGLLRERDLGIGDRTVVADALAAAPRRALPQRAARAQLIVLVRAGWGRSRGTLMSVGHGTPPPGRGEQGARQRSRGRRRDDFRAAGAIG